MPIEKAIKEFRFAFSRAAAQLQIAPPMHAPALGVVPPDIARLFERAFSALSSRPGARPTAQEWATGLNVLQKQLKVCPQDAGHKFSAHLGRCCWCDLMQGGAPNFFVSVTIYRLGSTLPSLTFVLGVAWAEIDRVPRPNTAYRRPPLPTSSQIAPTVLPAHIPSRVPPAVLIPPPPAPPPVVVPPVRIPPPTVAPRSRLPPPVVVSRKAIHKGVGWTACACAVVFFITFVVACTSRSLTGTGSETVALLAAFMLISAFIFAMGWLIYEIKHESAVRTANAERDAILEDLKREKGRREAAYQIAVRTANAERDAILAKLEQEKTRREAAYRAAVRSANAERDAIIAAMRRERDRRLQAHLGAQGRLEVAENEWRDAASSYEESFDRIKRGLANLKSDYLGLKQQYEQEYRDLERNKEADQRVQFLQTQFISDHDIPGIGPTREAVLRSNGVETAYDIEQERILKIDGFGPVLTGNLLVWKQQAIGRFRFNAAAAVSSSELAALVVKYKQYQQRIETKLQSGLTELRDCSDKASRHLSQLYARMPGLVSQVAQAKVDVEALSDDGV